MISEKIESTLSALHSAGIDATLSKLSKDTILGGRKIETKEGIAYEDAFYITFTNDNCLVKMLGPGNLVINQLFPNESSIETIVNFVIETRKVNEQ